MSTPKERPILFSGEMVRAILEGRKTQTRRVVKCDGDSLVGCHLGEARFRWKDGRDTVLQCPHGQPGDRLWVRETWCGSQKTMRGYFRADLQYWDHQTNEPRPECGMPDKCKWKPSIFMPRWASRITLEITKVRVERLQGISEEDAIEEGTKRYDMPAGKMEDCPSYRDAYKCLWGSINGKGSWEKNPWVWVIEFRRIKL